MNKGDWREEPGYRLWNLIQRCHMNVKVYGAYIYPKKSVYNKLFVMWQRGIIAQPIPSAKHKIGKGCVL
jgi:hypothetical protein